MKNFKTLLIPVGLIVLVTGIFAFTNPTTKDEEDKCTIKIIKIVDGVTTEVDSTFDCGDEMAWEIAINDEKGGSLEEMIKKIMNEVENSESFNFNLNIESDDESLTISGEDSEEKDLHFEMNMLNVEGMLEMKMNGKEMNLRIEDFQTQLKKLKENINVSNDGNGTMQLTINTDDENGKESHTIEIYKTVDDDGNVTVMKTINGEEVELDDEDIAKMKKGRKVTFSSDDENGKGNNSNFSMTIDVDVEDEESENEKHIVIISKVTSSNKSDKKIAKTIDLNKKELTVEKLKFSPNPNDGIFDLSFKLDKKQAVQLKIVDLQGKEVYNEKINDFKGKYSNKIDISNNGEGIYILQITQNDKASTSKIVIK